MVSDGYIDEMLEVMETRHQLNADDLLKDIAEGAWERHKEKMRSG
jgi:hypothetical protein